MVYFSMNYWNPRIDINCTVTINHSCCYNQPRYWGYSCNIYRLHCCRKNLMKKAEYNTFKQAQSLCASVTNCWTRLRAWSPALPLRWQPVLQTADCRLIKQLQLQLWLWNANSSHHSYSTTYEWTDNTRENCHLWQFLQFNTTNPNLGHGCNISKQTFQSVFCRTDHIIIIIKIGQRYMQLVRSDII